VYYKVQLPQPYIIIVLAPTLPWTNNSIFAKSKIFSTALSGSISLHTKVSTNAENIVYSEMFTAGIRQNAGVSGTS